jgi:hypothetical protein
MSNREIAVMLLNKNQQVEYFSRLQDEVKIGQTLFQDYIT